MRISKTFKEKSMLSFPRPENGHPCFNESSCAKSGRVHLPVAPECNTACNFCNRKFDCPNEGRPGVSSTILRPEHAVPYLKMLEGQIPLDVVGIAGPGDPLANPEKVFAALKLVRKTYPGMAFCMATNGLALPEHTERIAELGVGFMTVTVNAATTGTGARIYRWARWKRKVLRGEEAAGRILENQLTGIRLLKEAGITVKVNTVLIPGINDLETEDIADMVRLTGADVMNILPMLPVADTPFSGIASPTLEALERARLRAGTRMKQISHCRRCRADAAGSLANGLPPEKVATLLRHAAAYADKPRVAIASREGVLVNQHLGDAGRFLIFASGDAGPELVEERTAPPSGCGDSRWTRLCELLDDCAWVAVTGIGERPREILESAGVRPVLLSGTVAEVAAGLLRGENCSHLAVGNFSCAGNGLSCA